MNRLLMVSVAIVVISVLALVALSIIPRQQPHISPTVELIDSGGNITRLNVEIADTDESRRYGLMNRSYLGEKAGMLFVFNSDSPQTFWMKDTLIPLDIVFITNNLTIINIHTNATPMSKDHIYSFGPCRYVLEVNGGFCDAYGISVGDRVRLDFDG